MRMYRPIPRLHHLKRETSLRVFRLKNHLNCSVFNCTLAYFSGRLQLSIDPKESSKIRFVYRVSKTIRIRLPNGTRSATERQFLSGKICLSKTSYVTRVYEHSKLFLIQSTVYNDNARYLDMTLVRKFIEHVLR